MHERAGHALASRRLLLGDDDDIYGDAEWRESVAQSHHLVELAVHLRLDLSCVIGAKAGVSYAVLLANDLVPSVLAEAEAICKASIDGKGDPAGPPIADVSNFVKLAELMRRYSNPEVKERLARLDLFAER